MSKQTDKLAEMSRKAEVRADYLLSKLVAFPYSWVPALAIALLAAYGALRLLS